MRAVRSCRAYGCASGGAAVRWFRGRESQTYLAAVLAAHGYSALSLAHFGEPGTVLRKALRACRRGSIGVSAGRCWRRACPPTRPHRTNLPQQDPRPKPASQRRPRNAEHRSLPGLGRPCLGGHSAEHNRGSRFRMCRGWLVGRAWANGPVSRNWLIDRERGGAHTCAPTQPRATTRAVVHGAGARGRLRGLSFHETRGNFWRRWLVRRRSRVPRPVLHP